MRMFVLACGNTYILKPTKRETQRYGTSMSALRQNILVELNCLVRVNNRTNERRPGCEYRSPHRTVKFVIAPLFQPYPPEAVIRASDVMT
jgi:hypothetical protein